MTDTVVSQSAVETLRSGLSTLTTNATQLSIEVFRSAGAGSRSTDVGFIVIESLTAYMPPATGPVTGGAVLLMGI